MNTKGVGDGISDEQAVREHFEDRGLVISRPTENYPTWDLFRWGTRKGSGASELLMWADARAKLPVEERTEINHIWSGKEKMPCGCLAKTEYPYYNAETGHVHCIACGNSYDHQSQIVPEERTAEMEELMGRLRTAITLGRRTAWLAYVWNDHNFQAAHIEARKECEVAGIKSFDQANEFLDAVDESLDHIEGKGN